MLHENFGSFFKEKQARRPVIKHDPEEIHDAHVDAVHHHLRQIHSLTHPDSDWHRAIKKMGGSSKYVSDLHKQITSIIKKHNE